MYRRSLAILEGAYGPDHDRLAITVNALRNLLIAEGRLREARGSYRRAVAILERARENDAFDPVLASSLVNLGLIEEALGDRSAAE
ncbi:MAG: tetratricopeptide repeat protein [Thermoanaerobaculia bacterium]